MSLSPMEERLRKGFRYFNRLIVVMWRMGLGRWINCYPPLFGRIMVISHIGRKTGLTYRTPVNYAMLDDGMVCCVAGFGEISDWYRNILIYPEVKLWLPDGIWMGEAEELVDVDAQERTRSMRKVLINSGFAAYAAGINPRKMSDGELADATKSYRLIRIHLKGVVSRQDNPADMLWLWPIAISLFILLLLIKKRRGGRK